MLVGNVDTCVLDCEINCPGSHSLGEEPEMGVLVQMIGGVLSGAGARGKQDGAREGRKKNLVFTAPASFPSTEQP